MNISPLTVNRFINNNSYILKVSGSHLEVAKRYSLFTLFAKLFCLKNYDFQHVMDFLGKHGDDLKALNKDLLNGFTDLLTTKIIHYNRNHPDHKIHVCAKILPLFRKVHPLPPIQPLMPIAAVPKLTKEMERKRQNVEQFLLDRPHHYRPEQCKELLDRFDQAILDKNPQKHFAELVLKGIDLNLWGKEKAQYINQEIAPLLAEQNPLPQAPQVIAPHQVQNKVADIFRKNFPGIGLLQGWPNSIFRKFLSLAHRH